MTRNYCFKGRMRENVRADVCDETLLNAHHSVTLNSPGEPFGTVHS